MSIRSVRGAQLPRRLLASPQPNASAERLDEAVGESVARGVRLLPVAEGGGCDDTNAGHRYYRPAAPFVAHVIATFQGLPQTRNRRRVAMNDAAAAYRNVQTTVSGAERLTNDRRAKKILSA
jgi:hypothetical protein